MRHWLVSLYMNLLAEDGVELLGNIVFLVIDGRLSQADDQVGICLSIQISWM